MKLHFLGTGADDWDNTKADASGEFRRNCSLLVDGRLLIDPGYCIFEFEKTFGYNGLYNGVKDIICTHRHRDHYSQDTVDRLTAAGAVYHETVDGDILELEHYIVRVFPANHCTAKNPVHFVIESKDDGKRFFYGCDGAWLPYSTFVGLKNLRHFDMMLFDCTIGDIHGDFRIFEHNNVAMASEMKASLSCICSRFMVSHLARTLYPNRSETEDILRQYGLEAAYDNMITEV